MSHVKVEREGVLKKVRKNEGGRCYKGTEGYTERKLGGGGGEQMSEVVGGRERNSLCYIF